MGDLVLVTGGARTGKSRYAEALSAGFDQDVVYIATMQPLGDPELAIRIEAHRARRPGHWTTVEEPLRLSDALRKISPAAPVLVDCLTLWVSNLLFEAAPDASAATAADWSRAVGRCVAAADELRGLQDARSGPLVAVTNEVGMGIVPADALSRAFRDAAGLVNQRIAASSSRVVLMVSGLPFQVFPR